MGYVSPIELEHLLIAFIFGDDPRTIRHHQQHLLRAQDLPFALILDCVVDFRKGSGTGMSIDGHDLAS